LTAGRRCSDRSRGLGEAIRGTASPVRSWLLLEQPGAWPDDALGSRHLPARFATALARQANAAGVRVVLIRRPGRPTRVAGDAVVCYLAHARRVDPWLVRVELGELDDVLDLDLAALAGGWSPDDGKPAGPIFCVCTHGSHDPCCAMRGRPVAAAMYEEFPEQTWEISHIGGDRFAANVVCFPHGVYLGRVEPEDAVAVARSYANGQLPLANLRGRCCDVPVVQAADCFLRDAYGLTGIDDVRALTRRRTGAIETVRFALHGQPGEHLPVVAVQVRVRAANERYTLTCHADRQVSPPTYDLVEIHSEPGPS
jgi:hypothetical protein